MKAGYLVLLTAYFRCTSVTMGSGCRYPYLIEAKVVGVTDGESEWVNGAAGVTCNRLSADASQDIAHSLDKVLETLLSQQGISARNWTSVALKVRPSEGLIRTVDGAIEKRFSKETVLVPLQLAMRCHPAAAALDSRMAKQAQMPELEVGEQAIYLGRLHYGSLATVVPYTSGGVDASGAVKSPAGDVASLTTVHIP